MNKIKNFLIERGSEADIEMTRFVSFLLFVGGVLELLWFSLSMGGLLRLIALSFSMLCFLASFIFRICATRAEEERGNYKWCRVVFMNATIMTAVGDYSCREIDVDEARKIIDGAPSHLSAIGHDAAAQAMSTLFDRKIEANHISYSQEIGDIAIALKMKKRAEEGTIMTLEEMEKVGYELFSIIRTP